MPHRFLHVAASVLLCCCLTAGAEPLYRVTWLPQEMGVSDMNGAGHVAGYVFTPAGPRIATWSDAGLQIRPELGSPAGMNEHDDFVATRSDGPPPMPIGAWAWIGRAWRSIGAAAPEFGYIFARALNDGGSVVGELADSQSSSARRPFLYRNGDLRLLPTLGGTTGRANDINNHGRITGQAALRNPDGSESRHAFLLDSTSGRMRDLGTLGTGDSEGLDINDRGQVVGISGSRGFLYSGGRMVDVGTLGGGPRHSPCRSTTMGWSPGADGCRTIRPTASSISTAAWSTWTAWSPCRRAGRSGCRCGSTTLFRYSPSCAGRTAAIRCAGLRASILIRADG